MRIALLALAVLSGCQPGSSIDAGGFYSLPESKQQQQLRTFDVEDQLDIVLYGMERLHPPPIYLYSCFAANGEAGVTAIRRRLAQRRLNDPAVVDVGAILEYANGAGTYPVWKDTQLVRALSERVEQMPSSDWKTMAGEKLESISSAPKQRLRLDPNCSGAPR
jgi:hypothetical protein